MAEKSIYGTTSSNEWTFRIDVYERSQSIENNTSAVRGDIWLGRANSTSVCGGDYSGVLTIDGQQQAYSGTINYPTYVQGGSWLYIATKDFTITHNADGSKTIGVSCTWNANFAPNSASASGDLVLDTIPRASKVTCPSFNLGDSTVINIERASSSFTHTLTYAIGNITGTIATKTSQTSVGWTPNPTAIYSAYPTSTVVQGSITCKTYSGDTLIGTSTCNFSAYITVDVPTVSATIVDTNSATIALTGNSSKLVKYYSHPQITISATAKKEAQISSYKTEINDGQSSNTQTTTFPKIEAEKVIVSATDSRGWTGSTEYTPQMVPYVKLAFTKVKINRTESTSDSVEATIEGNYFNGSFGSQSNTLTLKWRYVKVGESWSNYTTVVPTISNNKFTFTATLGSNFDNNSDYYFEFVVEDKLMSNISTGDVLITKGVGIIDIYEDLVQVNQPVLTKYGLCIDNILNGLIPRVDQNALANWDNLYNQLGINAYLVYDYFGNLGAPNGAYLYGMLIVICGNLNASSGSQFHNLQIYIPDGVYEAGTRDMNRMFIRNGTGAWLGINGIKFLKKTS